MKNQGVQIEGVVLLENNTGMHTEGLKTNRSMQIEEATFLVQNCGFAEFDDDCDEQGWEEGWRGLEGLVQLTGAPVILTSYTKGEAEKDLERLIKYCEKEKLEVMVRCQPNEMRSRRPVGDWELDQDNDLFYANQYYSVVRAIL